MTTSTKHGSFRKVVYIGNRTTQRNILLAFQNPSPRMHCLSLPPDNAMPWANR